MFAAQSVGWDSLGQFQAPPTIAATNNAPAIVDAIDKGVWGNLINEFLHEDADNMIRGGTHMALESAGNAANALAEGLSNFSLTSFTPNVPGTSLASDGVARGIELGQQGVERTVEAFSEIANSVDLSELGELPSQAIGGLLNIVAAVVPGVGGRK